MSGRDRPHLSPVPGPYDEIVRGWLIEPENVSSAHVIDEAIARAFRTRRSYPRPWDRAVESLRPEPFGTSVRHLGLVLFVVGLILAVVAAGLLAGGFRLGIGPVTSSSSPLTLSPSASPSSVASPSSAVFPLAGLPLEFVINEGNHQSPGSTSAALAVIRADGTSRREIGRDIQDDLVWPEWVPGTDAILALQGTFSATEQIWTIDANGTAGSQVLIPCVSPCASRNESAVSRDGAKVVFFQAWGPIVNDVPETCGLSMYEFATQAIIKVTDHACGPSIEERHPRFSPDDRTLAFWRFDPADRKGEPNPGSAIFLRDLATGEETRLTEYALGASHLDWSPDGQWIVFVPKAWGEGGAGSDLWRIHPDGSGLGRLTALDTAETRLLRPMYTPDGGWIVFSRQDSSRASLLGIPANGGTPVNVLPGFQVWEHDERAIP
jgi:hypothetical protein